MVDQFGIVYCEYHYIGFKGIYATIWHGICNKIYNKELKQRSFYSNLIRPSSGNMLNKKFMKTNVIRILKHKKMLPQHKKECYVAKFKWNVGVIFFPDFLFFFHPRMFVPSPIDLGNVYFISFIYHSYSVIASVLLRTVRSPL